MQAYYQRSLWFKNKLNMIEKLKIMIAKMKLSAID